jgi:hypothetical protein
MILDASLFGAGEHLAAGAGVVTVVLFVVLWSGGRSQEFPARGAARGRILSARQLRWVCPALAIAGLCMMLAASL